MRPVLKVMISGNLDLCLNFYYVQVVLWKISDINNNLRNIDRLLYEITKKFIDRY